MPHPTRNGGPKGRPAGNESHSQKTGSFFMAQNRVKVSYKYFENQVADDYLEKIEAEAKASPKNHAMKFFYMKNHYSNLYGYQKSGYHWFYLSGEGKHYCTCGLEVPQGSKVESSLGHRKLPSFESVVNVFINCCNFDPSLAAYEYGAYCQLCGKGSLRNLLKKDVDEWIKVHKEDCPERDKLKGLS